MRAFSHLGYIPSAIIKPKEISVFSHIVIPGVSTFGSVVNELHELDLFYDIQNLIGTETKVLGLCAGMQIMGTGSAENPQVVGLSWFNYQVQTLNNPEGQRVFHTGWNSTLNSSDLKSKELQECGVFYFNHSFFVCASDSPSKTFTFTPFMNNRVLSSFQHLNIRGIQFHPEKSQISGLSILNDFAQW